MVTVQTLPVFLFFSFFFFSIPNCLVTRLQPWPQRNLKPHTVVLFAWQQYSQLQEQSFVEKIEEGDQKISHQTNGKSELKVFLRGWEGELRLWGTEEKMKFGETFTEYLHGDQEWFLEKCSHVEYKRLKKVLKSCRSCKGFSDSWNSECQCESCERKFFFFFFSWELLELIIVYPLDIDIVRFLGLLIDEKYWEMTVKKR